MNGYVKQIREIRTLCKLLFVLQEGIFTIISDKLDEFEAENLKSGNDVNESASDEKSGESCNGE